MSQRALPAGWTTAQLGELIEFKYGKALPDKVRSGCGFPVFGSNGIVGMHSDALTSGPTLIVGRKGSVGVVHYSATSCSPIDTTYFVDQVPIAQFRYWYYQLKSLNLSTLNKSTAIPGLSRGDVYPLEIRLPPSPEQQRIADKLDTVLARVDAVNARLARVAPLLKRFRQSVLAAATSGHLSADWRVAQHEAPETLGLIAALKSDHEAAGGHERGNASEPTKEAHDLTLEQLPVGWQVCTLKDCCAPGRPITYGILKPGPELEEGVPYIRVADFPGNRLNLAGIKKTSPEIDIQYKRARLIGGDLLLSIRGSVGRLIEIPSTLEGANITQDTARLSLSRRLNPKYVYFALLAPDTQRRMSNAIRGVAVRGINIGDVRALQVPLPSQIEQTEIVHRVELLFAFADRLEARLQAAQTATSRLTPSLLAKAFRGELVPQDPNDEPATELLRSLSQNKPDTTPRGRKPRAKQTT